MAVLQELTAGDPRRVGRYRIVARLGAGGMGQVYLGRSPGGRAVAVKVVRPELAEDPDFRRRFAREVAAARRVNGVFTAGVVDADAEGTQAWLATSYVPGMSLGEAVSAHGRWPAQPVFALGAALAEALEAIHAAGVIHRDFKPSNVLLAADGPRVIDFGISVVGDASALTSTGMVVGTPGFMAPEQVVGGPVGPACDVFALGAVLAYTATATPPFGTGPAHAVNFRAVYEKPNLTAVPPVLRDLVESCLAKEAVLRPALPELLEQLTDLDGDDPVSARSLADADWLPTPVARELRTRLSAPVSAPASPAVGPAPPESAPQPESVSQPESVPSATVDPAEEPTPSDPPGTTATVTLRPTAASASAPAPFRLTRRHLLLAVAGVTAAAGVSTAIAAVAERYDTDSNPPSGTGDKAASEWTVSLPADVTGPPTVAGGLVYALADGGRVRALDAATGTQRWSADIGSGSDASGILVTGGTAYLVGAFAVQARNAATGSRKWSFSADSQLNGQLLRVADGTVYTGGQRAAYAIDAVSGAQRWELPLRERVLWAPADADGMTYIGAGDTVYAVDAATGERHWTFVVDSALDPALPTLVDGMLVLGGMRWDNGNRVQLTTLYAVDTTTGKARWKIRTPHALRSLTAADGLICAGVLPDHLYVLDAGTGKQQWSIRTGNDNYMHPVVAGDTVYVSSENRHFTALDAVTGTKLWGFTAASPLWAEPAVADGVVYLAEHSGTLSALGAASGSRLWSLATHSTVKYPPVVAGGALYLAAGRNLHALPL